MNVHDEMSDNEVLRAASDSLSAIPMATPPDVAAIMARGRARRTAPALRSRGPVGGRRRRRYRTGARPDRRARPGPGARHDPDRGVHARQQRQRHGDADHQTRSELLDPAALQSDLAQYGIPAKVTTGSFCSSDPAPAGFSQVVSFTPAGPYTATPQNGAQPTITIDPAAMPAGTELSVGDFQLSSGEFSGQQQADFVLIDTSSYTCSSTPPDPNGLPVGYGPADGIGLLYGGPGPAGS